MRAFALTAAFALAGCTEPAALQPRDDDGAPALPPPSGLADEDGVPAPPRCQLPPADDPTEVQTTAATADRKNRATFQGKASQHPL